MSPDELTIAICDHCGGASKPGEKLRSALLRLAGTEGFRVEAVSCFASCDRPLAVAFTAPGKASYLFGEIDPDKDVDALLSFGRLYRSLADGWSKESDRPGGLHGKTLARIPCLHIEQEASG